ncbi:hypothetical protein KPH14_007396 [Odynerus spinipes]|uniref:Crossover junction endonuclease MUS81 n=1 Tax=Odynerus spinipes TaxID=1348599 RepID=A0AAD9RAT5_9HYME|nr:hypothetical protein KPH14_007396 [Odynerus spinipes]
MKRVKVTLNKPNPLFELWLEQWKEKAVSQGSDLQYHFTKALNALRKYPLPLDSGKDCIILKHFGSKLCTMLDKKLEEYKVHKKEIAHTNKICECDSCCCSELFFLSREKRIKMYKEEIANYRMRQTQAQNKNCSLPSWSITCYAILLTLYDKEEDPSCPGYMCKSELLHGSKQLYNVSLQLLDPGIYDGRSSIFILIASGLIYMKQLPIRYYLTTHGIHLAKKIKDILNLPSYDKQLLQIYFTKLQDSLPTLNCNHVTKKIDVELSTKNLSLCVKARESPKKINEINVVKKEESKIKALNHVKKHDKKSELKQSSNVAVSMLNEDQEEIQLKAYSFDIILLVDTQETCGGKTKPQHDATWVELKQLGILFEVRHLKIGDFTWIAKCRHTKNELVLPYIAERKRLDDLGASIKDGRFHEQKFRLKQSGIQNLVYIVESYEKFSRTGIPLSTLLQASINSLVQDGFIVKYTDNHQDSMSYLAILTNTLYKIYAGKKLIECKKENIIPVDIFSNSVSLMKFEEFNKAASKLKNFSVCQMFVRQLLQLKGMSIDKALAIVQSYPTPLTLINALQKSDCGETLIATIQYGQQKRQIGPAISKTVYLFYTQQELK